jgi:negative regulator of flagellin synthesis FlgM
MDIRSSLEGLKTLLGGTQAATAASPSKTGSGTAPGASAQSSDRATLSSAGSEVSQTGAEPGVRMDKVASVQAALAAGTYYVPVSRVASSVVGAMLGGGQ